jgi:hypothetical protein
LRIKKRQLHWRHVIGDSREGHDADSAIGVERKRAPSVGNVRVERKVLHSNGREACRIKSDEPCARCADLGCTQLQHCRGRAVALLNLLALREQSAALSCIENEVARNGERQ